MNYAKPKRHTQTLGQTYLEAAAGVLATDDDSQFRSNMTERRPPVFPTYISTPVVIVLTQKDIHA